MNPQWKTQSTPLYFFSFILSIQYALVVYINSSFLAGTIGEKFFGLLFTGASFLTIIVLFELPRLLNRFGNYRATLWFILLNAFALALLALSGSPIVIILAFLLYNIANFSLLCFKDVFIEKFSEGGQTGKVRGILLTVMNFGFVFAPVIAGFLTVPNLGSRAYAPIYILSAILTTAGLFFIFPHFRKFADPHYSRISIKETLSKARTDKNLRKIYFSEFLLRFFFSWMVIYMPIYLREVVGFDWKSIGVIFSVMLLPFVIVDYPLGKLSDKIGEKKILAYSYGIMAIATMAIFFLHTQNIFLWALVLFITRVGAAGVEDMNESYFFKKIHATDASLISFFRNMYPIALVVSPLLATCLLYFIDYQTLFFILGVILLWGIYLSFSVREIIR